MPPYSFFSELVCTACSGLAKLNLHKHWGAGLPPSSPVPNVHGMNPINGKHMHLIWTDPPTAECRTCRKTTRLSLPLPEKAELPRSVGRLVPQIKEYSSTWGIKGGHPQGKWPRQTIPDGIDEDELAYWRARADKAASTILRHHLHHSLHKKKKKIIKEYEALDKAALDLMSRGLSQKKTAEVFRTSDKHLKELSAGKAPWRFKPLEHQPSLSGDPLWKPKRKELVARKMPDHGTLEEPKIKAGLAQAPNVPESPRKSGGSPRKHDVPEEGTRPLEAKRAHKLRYDLSGKKFDKEYRKQCKAMTDMVRNRNLTVAAAAKVFQTSKNTVTKIVRENS